MDLLFTRKEYKYSMPLYLFNESLAYFSRKLKNDEYNKDCKPYVVRSLYFDSPTFMHVTEKIGGNPYRRKIRLRTYGGSKEKQPLFIEIKNKYIDKIFKERSQITKGMNSFLKTYDFSQLKRRNNTDVIDKCFMYQKMYGLRPKVIVFYRRISFVDKKLSFKVNVDYEIKSAKDLSIWLDEGKFRPVLKNKIILELKCEKIVPNFFLDFVRENNLQRGPYSKYSESVENIYGSME